jgi:hypothetical protein
MALAIAEEAVFLFGFFIQMALMPAILLIGFWFQLQVFSEVGSAAGTQGAGVAYMAHSGYQLYALRYS